VEEELDRDRVLRPGEVANLVAQQFTLYGPGINVTSLPALLFRFESFSRVVYRNFSNILLATKVLAKSSFLSKPFHTSCFL
jgi:hypothetical protein